MIRVDPHPFEGADLSHHRIGRELGRDGGDRPSDHGEGGEQGAEQPDDGDHHHRADELIQPVEGLQRGLDHDERQKGAEEDHQRDRLQGGEAELVEEHPEGHPTAGAGEGGERGHRLEREARRSSKGGEPARRAATDGGEELQHCGDQPPCGAGVAGAGAPEAPPTRRSPSWACA